MNSRTGIYIAFLTVLLNAIVSATVTDINGDNTVDMGDFAIMSSQWFSGIGNTSLCGDAANPYPYSDIDGDCFVGISDLEHIVRQWLTEDYTLSGTQITAQLKDEYFNCQDHQWAKWVVANFSPTRIHFEPWTDAQRQQFIDEYNPDHICEWAGPSVNRGDFCRARGITANTTHEYGANEELNELRGHSITVLKDNGLAVKENGKYADGGWVGTYLLCRNAPKWMELSKQSSGRQAVYGDGIFHDKLGSTISWADQGYCRWCNKKFKDYMINRFTNRQLWDMGFDKNTFDLSQYITAKRKTIPSADLPQEPIIHEYIRFQYISHLKSTVEIIDNYHKSALKAGKPIPAFYGNQELISGARPFTVVLSAHSDIVWSEQSICYQRPLNSEIQAFSTLLWKLGRAASNYEKPVWAVQYQAGSPTERPFGFGADKKYPTALALAEAAACGGVMCQTWTATAYNLQNVSDVLLEGHRHHSNFVGANRGLFTDRTAVAQCAVVYSVPSMFWRYCYRLTQSNIPHIKHFGAAARLLEDEHIPYNAILFGHKDVYDDTADIASLPNYKTIVIPYADCISDMQAQAVTQWTRAGGKLILWAYENVGTRDEELTTRGANVFEELIADSGAGLVEMISTAQAEEYIQNANATALQQIAADTANPIIQTTLPQTVWFNIWRHGAGPMMSVQMFNNDIDVDNDSYRAVENFTVRLRVPSGVNFSEVRYINTGYAGQVPTTAQSLPFTVADGFIEVNVPTLDMFGILSFCEAGEYDARMAAGQMRKWYERLKIALRCEGASVLDYTALLEQSKELLEQIQGAANVQDFHSITALLDAGAAELQTAVNAVTAYLEAVKDADTQAAMNVTAYKKFDFGNSGAPAGWTEITTTSRYDASLGYGWDDSSFFTTTRIIEETFDGIPNGLFPDNLDLNGWELENYDSAWGSDLKNAEFNMAGQLLLTANIAESYQGLRYYLPSKVKDWANEWTIIPVGPAGKGYWCINIINGAASYGRFQVFFGRNGANHLLVKAGVSGWTDTASVNLPSTPEVIKIRLVWNNTAKKISAYYGLNGAQAATPLLLNYSMGEPVDGDCFVNLRNFEWGMGTVSIPAGNIYQTLVDNCIIEAQTDTIDKTETFNGNDEQPFPDGLDIADWVFENYDNNWGTDLKNAAFNGQGQLVLTANKSEACQGLKYNISSDATNWESVWTIKPVGIAGSGFWVINSLNGASTYGRVQIYFGKNGGNQLAVYGGSTGWALITSKTFEITPESIAIKLAWNQSTNKLSVYYGTNGQAPQTAILSNYSQSEPVGGTTISLRNMEWDFGTSGTPGNHTYQTLVDNWEISAKLAPTVGQAANHSYPDALHRDFIRSKDPANYATGFTGNSHFPYSEPQTAPATFNADLPNGNYIVTVITGDYQEFRTNTGGPSNEGRTSMTQIQAEGEDVCFGDRCRSGYFQNKTFPVTVSDGQLNLRFSGKAVGPLYCNPIEWLVNGVIIQTPAQQPAPLALRSLTQNDLINRSAIRKWNVIGTFDDSDCLGMETNYGPELEIDATAQYNGKSGIIQWQQLPPLKGTNPYVDFAAIFDDTNQSAAMAACYVYCPARTEAVLLCSMSQSSIVYLNGSPVFRDELAAGLLPDEQHITISLEQGWNSLLFKCLNHWGYEWKLWAGLLNTDRTSSLTEDSGIIVDWTKTN